MSQTLSPTMSDCLDAVSSTFSAVFARIDGWRVAIEALASDSDGTVTVREVDDLTESLVLASLSAENALTIGAGFVARPGFLVDSEYHLAWWLGHSNTFGVGSADPILRRLVAEEDPSSEQFRDYTTLEWWRVPAATGARHITGPYVDYLCTDDYTLTLTVPVRYRESLIGVVGTDLYVNDIERVLLPHVRAIGGPATVINASGRVVVSTDPHRPTGSLFRTDAPAIPCGDTSLRLVLR
ncbi:MAG: PDC sensor domain-containing protein [Salinibacterium sp.]|nr:PDC sensor domain-containing protein [Salinibacterium sp.]